MSFLFNIKDFALKLFLLSLIILMGFNVSASNSTWAQNDVKKPTFLYRTTLMRAAPGKLTELITLLKGLKDGGYYEMLDQKPPFIMRHSQGDHWDLMLLYPMVSYEDYYNSKNLKLRKDFKETIEITKSEINARVAFKEDLFAFGPDVDLIAAEYAKSNLFHIEIFFALAGQHEALLVERGMENDYLRRLGKTETLLWVADQGADYDSFTIGFHKSLLAYADPGTATEIEITAARIAAGFPAQGDDIGAYLRRFLARHHDTLATPVR
jgi:hypothetical protein